MGMALFSVQDALIKFIYEDAALYELYFGRTLVALLLLVCYLKFSKQKINLKTHYPFLTILRVICFFFGFSFFYISLTYMSLAMANALFFSSPFFVSILAVIFLKEKVGIRRWLGITVGFLGVYIVLDPNFEDFNYMKLAPVACALCYAISMTITKYTSRKDNVYTPTLAGSYDATGEHSGDVLTTNSGSHADTDADSDTLVVSAVRVGSSEGNGTAGTLGQALTGTYGQLTLNANGSYSYVANQDAADALDAGDTVNDVFNYTVSDGNEGTDIATITITILGANDAPVAQNDVGVIDEGQTLSVANGANANVSGNYDADDEHTGDVIHTSLAGSKDTDIDGDDTANLVVSAIRVGSTEGSGTAGTVGQALTGSFGALTLNANGSYSYVAATTSGLFSGDTRTDYFNYTVSDGTATDTATLTITILGVGTAPSNDCL